MMSEEVSDPYICIAFHYESTIDRLVEKGLLDRDFVDSYRKTFYDSLDEEKLRVSKKIRSQTEIIQRYVRAMVCGGYGFVDKNSKTKHRGFSWICHSKLDEKPQYSGVFPSMGK